MDIALEEALKAYSENEVPVGCVIVKNEQVISKAHNTNISKRDITAHAEIEAIRKACKKLNSADLKGCDIYVTLEPCPMCAGAIINSKISTLIFGATDIKYGAFGGYYNLASHPYATNLTVYAGIKEKECSDIIKKFFVEIRNTSNDY